MSLLIMLSSRVEQKSSGYSKEQSEGYYSPKQSSPERGNESETERARAGARKDSQHPDPLR